MSEQLTKPPRPGAATCWTDAKLCLSLLSIYQFWCDERITNAGRAFDVVHEMHKGFLMKHKTSAVDFFMSRGWSDTRTKAKELVRLIWTLKDLYPPHDNGQQAEEGKQ